MKLINRRTAGEGGALALKPTTSFAQDAVQPFGADFPELDPLATGGGSVSLGAPPSDAGEDWLAVVRK